MKKLSKVVGAGMWIAAGGIMFLGVPAVLTWSLLTHDKHIKEWEENRRNEQAAMRAEVTRILEKVARKPARPDIPVR